tara:strand:- start:135 stop:236 length:102 start_codon:yes stop_codon:yes gene_type:complete
MSAPDNFNFLPKKPLRVWFILFYRLKNKFFLDI